MCMCVNFQMCLLEQPAFNCSDHYTLQIKSFQGKNEYQRKDIEKILHVEKEHRFLNWVWTLAPPFTSCVKLGTVLIFEFSMPQLPQVWNGVNNSCYNCFLVLGNKSVETFAARDIATGTFKAICHSHCPSYLLSSPFSYISYTYPLMSMLFFFPPQTTGGLK